MKRGVVFAAIAAAAAVGAAAYFLASNGVPVQAAKVRCGAIREFVDERAKTLKNMDPSETGIPGNRDGQFDAFLDAQIQSARSIRAAARSKDTRAVVLGLPKKVKRQVKMTIARMKLAIGPAATMAARALTFL